MINDRPTLKMSIKDVEYMTGLKVIDIEPSRNWMRLRLENGVMFVYKKWTYDE